MTLHCMLDLETLSTAGNAVMLSIGAVKYDPAGVVGEYVDEFHCGVDLTSYKNLIGNAPFSFDISPDTILWWFDAKMDVARHALNALEKVTLPTALEGFATWYIGTNEDSGDGAIYPDKPEAIWSNGATFDITILKRTYELVGMECPWTFRQENCYRTLYNLRGKQSANPEDNAGVAHDALWDAKWQADKLRLMLRSLAAL